jgi:hypothetical protein
VKGGTACVLVGLRDGGDLGVLPLPADGVPATLASRGVRAIELGFTRVRLLLIAEVG